MLDENLGHSVLVVRYEDLKRDSIAEVSIIHRTWYYDIMSIRTLILLTGEKNTELP